MPNAGVLDTGESWVCQVRKKAWYPGHRWNANCGDQDTGEMQITSEMQIDGVQDTSEMQNAGVRDTGVM